MNTLVAPSILAADFGRLNEEIRMINESQGDWIHVDIMDGVFVPNISMGLPIVEAVKRQAKKPLDVHLMIVRPENLVDAFCKAGASSISVHVEVCHHLHRNIQQIKSLGCMAGVAINPHTPLSDLENIIADIDLVCVMSVNPGFGGQQFIENTYAKVAQLKKLIIDKKSKALIEVDGGVSEKNAKAIVAAGADVLVAGHCVFSAKDPSAVIANLKSSNR